VTGPKWQPTRRCGDVYTVTQSDSSGVVWMLMAREQGGRVLRWQSVGDKRVAMTSITAAHPQYPSDEAVAAEVRATQREQRDAYRRLVRP
jgi:hypothetical protein